MSRTRRKPYTGAKAVDKSCRGKRGSCPTCSENRQYKNTKREVKMNLDNWSYCQSEIEDNGKCDAQCEHCEEYYKPIEPKTK